MAAVAAILLTLATPNALASGRILDLQMYGRPSSTQTAVTLAKNYSIIVTNPSKLSGYVPAMRKANPQLKILVYMNGMYSYSSEGSHAYPSDWYLHSAGGAQIRSKGYGNYLMNGRNAGWQKHVADECVTEVKQIAADGCFLDMLGPAPLSPGYNQNNLVPVDPATGKPFTNSSWMAMTGGVGAAVQTLSGYPVEGNGLGSGAAFSYTHTLADPLDFGALAEVWMRTAGASAGAFPSVSAWLADERVPSYSSPTNVCVKVWVSASNMAQWRRFAYGSFLLADDGLSHFEFSPSQKSGWNDDDPIYHLALGSPLAGMVRDPGGTYHRDFATGYVVVNPTGSPVHVSVPVKGLITLPAHDALIETT